MNWKDDLAEEMGYTICPICFPEYVYCDEKCNKCKEYIEFKNAVEGRRTSNDKRTRSNRNIRRNGKKLYTSR